MTPLGTAAKMKKKTAGPPMPNTASAWSRPWSTPGWPGCRARRKRDDTNQRCCGRRPRAEVEFSLIDSDVHNYPNSLEELFPYLSERWRAYARQSGFKMPGASHYPKIYQHAARRDAYPPGGKIPGSDPDFARGQLLDAWRIDRAILIRWWGSVRCTTWIGQCADAGHQRMDRSPMA